ncbi:hypothetical protein GCM10010275_40780 [Streptomyces litmocidini]|nr:hypothetical protein GCM10010275_40780 [Streptomyces litmocidini]
MTATAGARADVRRASARDRASGALGRGCFLRVHVMPPPFRIPVGAGASYDTAAHGFRFGDVLDLVHASPDPAEPWQGALFRYALDRRHHPERGVPPLSGPLLTARRTLLETAAGRGPGRTVPRGRPRPA